MKDTLIADCKGFFYDSQGPTSIYLNDEDFVFTISSGGTITLSFDSFCVESVDSLRFFDGPDTFAVQIGPAYSGTLPPPIIVATSGSLTISFKSDNNVAYCGWSAYWTTVVPPPVPPLMTVSPIPACNSTTVDLVFSTPVRCSNLAFGNFTLSGPTGSSVVNVVPQGCVNDSTTSIQLLLDQPLDENCNYGLDFYIDLLDKCDSVWSFILTEAFVLTSCPANVTISVGSDSICAGTCTNIEAILASCLVYNYTWNQGLPSSSGPFTICPSVTTTYTVTVQDTGGLGPPETVSLTVYVVVPSITDSDTTLCQSDSAFDIQAVPAGGVWRGPGIIDSIAGTFNPDTSGPGLHSITYVLAGVCADTIFITVKPMDAGPDEAACPGSPAFLVSGFSPVGGIWSGDSIQSNGLFNPDTNGTYTITYSFNGCSEDKLVYVDNISSPITTDTVCQSVPPYDIPISPFGGRWFGTGITDSLFGTFDPDLAGGGLHDLLYQLNGCVDTVRIYVNEIYVDDLVYACPLQVPFLITPAAIPSGGWWTGIGILDSITGLYDPAALGTSNGRDTLIYELANGCTDTMVMRILQTFVGIDTVQFCIADDSLRLNWAGVKRAPGGGVWAGPGLVGSNNDYFKPGLAGAGVHTLVYTVNDCSDSITMIVYPELNSLDTLMCSSQAPFVIQQMPPGGYWWANDSGITDSDSGVFDPGIALQDSQYVYFATAVGCLDSVQIAVYQFETAELLGLDSVYCYEDQDYPFSFVPANGIFTGLADSSNFNPDSVGEGVYVVTISQGVGVCMTADTLEITVYPPLISSLSSSEDTICNGEGAVLTVLASGGDPNAIYSYSWNQGLFPISTNSVNPQVTTTYVVITSDGCSDNTIDSITVAISQPFSVSFQTSSQECYGSSGYAAVSVAGSSSYAYIWDTNPVQTSDSIIGTAGESYQVNIKDVVSGCEFDTLIKIPSYSIIYAMFSVTPNVECVSFDQKEQLTFIDLSKNAATGYWDIDGATVPYVVGGSPQITLENPGYYPVILTVYNEGGCEDTHSLELCIYDPVDLFVADAFSPNGDGFNDVLFVRGHGVVELDFLVYNRWGQKVFETHDINQGWDGTIKGKPLNSEVFVYYVKAVTNAGKEIIVKGDVSLVR